MRNHHIAKAAALMLCVVLACALQGCAAREKPLRVALISSADAGHYWENIQDGARTAAHRLGVELTCYAPDKEAGLLLEQLPELAREQGADTFIVASNGEKDLVQALSEVQGVTIIAVGNELSELSPLSTVLNDNAKMGQNMALALSGRLGETGSVLLLTDSAEYDTSEQRERTLRRGLYTQSIALSKRIFTGDNCDWAYRQTLQQLYLLPDLEAVIAFSAQSTVGAARAAKYLNRDLVIVGTDIVPELIEYIEDGSVTASVVRNSFGMGYLGVEYAAKHAAGEAVPTATTLSSVLVTRDNLFTPEIEKVVFLYE